MEKRQGRFDRLREEKKQYPFLYGKTDKPGAPAGKKETPEISDKASAAIANALRLLMNEKKS